MKPETSRHLQDVVESAKKYTRLADFRRAYPTALQLLNYHGLYHTATAHMEKLPPGATLKHSRSGTEPAQAKPFALQTHWVTAQLPATRNEDENEVQVRGSDQGNLERQGHVGGRSQHSAAKVVRGMRY